MADMENDEHIDAFLNAYAGREDMARSTLLLHRYRMREESDKIESARQYVLWQEIEHIITAANGWQEYLCKGPDRFKWFSETQLNYLNTINCLSPDKKHIVSGGTAPDLWCEAKILLGLCYTAALAKSEKLDAALYAFEDTVYVREQVMAIPNEESELGCSSPALKDFTLKSSFYWHEENRKEYKHLYMEHNEWTTG